MKCTFWILVLLIQGATLASDWPQWRGPNRDGVWTESGILSSFPSSGLLPKWKVPVGLGYSSPIIANGMLYLSDLVVNLNRDAVAQREFGPAGFVEIDHDAIGSQEEIGRLATILKLPDSVFGPSK